MSRHRYVVPLNGNVVAWSVGVPSKHYILRKRVRASYCMVVDVRSAFSYGNETTATNSCVNDEMMAGSGRSRALKRMVSVCRNDSSCELLAANSHIKVD